MRLRRGRIGCLACNLGPVLMGTSPRSHLARVQALLSLAQSGAVLLLCNLLGAIAHTITAPRTPRRDIKRQKASDYRPG